MNFKALREEKEWTQNKAAIECKVAVVTWRLWEYGVSKPNPENLKNIQEAFNIVPFSEE
jgi:transcriptional regulator with XRE-family HTH domain